MEYWKVSARGADIMIVCRGHDRERTLPSSLSDFRALAEARSEFAIYVDLNEMTGYERESRQQWQTLFREFRERIRKLVLIGARSALIRMGAAAVGAFAGVPVQFVDSWKELQE